MAHGEQCIGTWTNTMLGGQPDGDIIIKSHNTNQIKGTHVNTNSPISGTCNGQRQSFSRTDPNTHKKVHYKNGDITQNGPDFFIKGTFDEETVNESKSKRSKKKDAPPADEWTAEKST